MSKKLLFTIIEPTFDKHTQNDKHIIKKKKEIKPRIFICDVCNDTKFILYNHTIIVNKLLMKKSGFYHQCTKNKHVFICKACINTTVQYRINYVHRNENIQNYLAQLLAVCKCEERKPISIQWLHKILNKDLDTKIRKIIDTTNGNNKLTIIPDKYDKINEEWKQKNTKKCPNLQCKCPIQKRGGCDYMQCVRCGFEFCWSCLKSRSNSIKFRKIPRCLCIYSMEYNHLNQVNNINHNINLNGQNGHNGHNVICLSFMVFLIVVALTVGISLVVYSVSTFLHEFHVNKY